jgi:hypothetical protein
MTCPLMCIRRIINVWRLLLMVLRLTLTQYEIMSPRLIRKYNGRMRKWEEIPLQFLLLQDKLRC